MPRTSKEAIERGKLNQKLRSRQRKLDLVKRFGDACSVCKQTFPPCCYDFHHIDPNQKETKVSQLTGMALDRLEEEIKKCIMVCSNCHRIIHSYHDKGK